MKNNIPDSFVDKLIAVTRIKIEYKTKKKKLETKRKRFELKSELACDGIVDTRQTHFLVIPFCQSVGAGTK